MILRCSLALALFMLLAGAASAQTRVTIDDPELDFSYLLPKGWSNYDDDFYHYILSGDSTIQITVTYFDGMCRSLDECYTGEVGGRLPNEYDGFRLLEEYNGRIDGTTARWVAFTGMRDGAQYHVQAYYFIRLNQFFKVVAFLPAGATTDMTDGVTNIVRSLKIDGK